MALSKSDYMLYLRHPAWLWLKKHEKYRLPPIDENTQAMFDAGHKFESYAERLFPNGVKLGFNNYQEYMSLVWVPPIFARKYPLRIEGESCYFCL